MFNATSWLVDRHVDEGRGDRIAVVCEDRALSYGELQEATWKAANGLAELGVTPGDRVVLLVNDEAAFPAAFLGSMRMGALPVPLSTMLTAKDYAAIAADAGCTAVVASAEYAAHLPVIADAVPGLRAAVVVGTERTQLASAPVRLWSELDDATPVAAATTEADSQAFWLYTSGTTGLPKGAMHRHGSLRVTAENYAATVLGIAEDDRCFSIAKLFFAYGLGNSLTFPFSVGATSILDPRRPTPQTVSEMLAEHHPTLFFASPGFCAAMLDASVPREALESVRFVVTAGEALPGQLLERFRDHYGVEVLDGIGTTEALHIFCSNHPGRTRPGTSGTPVHGYDLKLLDDSDNEVTQPDTPGYLHVRGASIASGYWSRPEATEAAFRGDWLRTGDVYVRSDDGYYQFLGRTNDMIKAGGIWVSPAEVENVLIGHASVLEAAVVGDRDEHGLETVVGFVVPRSGQTIDQDALIAHCRERMASFKRPRRVIVVDALPKTATGKIQRYALRERLSAN